MLVTQTEIAEVFAKSRATVANWRKSGMPYQMDGKRMVFDVHDVLQWYIDKEAPANETSKDEALRRKMVADMRRAEVDAALAEGKLMEVEQHMQIVSAKITSARNSLLTLKSTMMPLFRTFAGDRAHELSEAMGAEIERVLTEMSQQ